MRTAPPSLKVISSHYSADQIVLAEALAYNSASSGPTCHNPDWPAESSICLNFGGSV